MKIFKFFLLALTLIVIRINAQEFDEDFLSSLPDDVKNDVLNRASAAEEAKKNSYSPYQYSSKLDKSESLSMLKVRIEQDLKELEKRLNLQDTSELKRFGSNFFSTFQTSFMPINEPNPDSSYILDIGDVLKIQLIGQEEYIEDFPINRNGAINLPDIGEISLVGLSLKDASEIIKARVKQSYIGVDSFVSLDAIRDVNILITGSAKIPGIYTLSGNSNMLHALSAAGGINKYGSYRAINLLRNNKVIEILDIYDLLVEGNYDIKKRLRSGDVIFVEPIKNIVTVSGAVQRPAVYEAKEDENLDKVISYANGIKKTADIDNVSLERILDGKIKSIPISNETQFKEIVVEDGDMLYIREFPYHQIEILGAVKKPGIYSMSSGASVSELIKKAGGYNNNAYPFGAIYLNEAAKKINEESNNILYAEFLDNLVAISQKNVGDNLDFSTIISLSQDIKTIQVNGRITVDLLDESFSNRFTVSDKDVLFIPEVKNNIYIYGEVSSEGAIMHNDNKDLDYYINKSGGYKKFADLDLIYILHPNGESQKYVKKRNIFENNPMNDLKIYPGSIIFVPRKLDETASRRLATQAYVSIIGNLGIALASLTSIKNN